MVVHRSLCSTSEQVRNNIQRCAFPAGLGRVYGPRGIHGFLSLPPTYHPQRAHEAFPLCPRLILGEVWGLPTHTKPQESLGICWSSKIGGPLSNTLKKSKDLDEHNSVQNGGARPSCKGSGECGCLLFCLVQCRATWEEGVYWYLLVHYSNILPNQSTV